MLTRITKEEALRAGELVRRHISWTNKELDLVIKTQEIVLAYIEGRGPTWELAAIPLRTELETFKNFMSSRKNNKPDYHYDNQ